MNMKNRRIALVTGASSGIGQATAELLAKAGHKVYGTSRRGGEADETLLPVQRLASGADGAERGPRCAAEADWRIHTGEKGRTA